MIIAKVLYIVSGTLWAIELMPQLIRTYKRKTVGDISIFFPLICLISFICFFIASFLAKNWILITSHAFPLICNIAFLLQVIIYRKKVTKQEALDKLWTKYGYSLMGYSYETLKKTMKKDECLAILEEERDFEARGKYETK